ncbi:MAG: bifunctional methylenetetrahydrofolate dehydrogenase/methenyltetrahydrofolate cyclohydrolase FolD [Clostridiaceae bacterium]|nr:bifunctional methylenetetrahydrofolate dehydrogenase/methenyltetrahydrofolate cyclohydrolase FolD [Clostridiaceae bacterium]
MMVLLIDGKKVSMRIREEIKKEVAELKEKGINPCLSVVLVGSDMASRTYVNNKKKACAEVGILSKEFLLPDEASEEELLELIDRLNKDKEVHGILVQLPLPKHIDEMKVIEAIDPKKDVDCFHPYNVGRLYTGSGIFAPCTPAGVMELIKETGTEIEGKECVVVGRSNIVGKPMAMLLLAANGTVTVTHSRTKDLKSVCKRADILVVAIGKAKFINEEYVKPGAIVIDVGMNRDENNKLCGDVDFERVKDICRAITPVPGGVGPMTITTLLSNTILAAKMFR